MKQTSTIALLVCIASFINVARMFAANKISDQEILRKIQHYDQFTRNIRRHLHFYPEVGGQEIETVKYLKKHLAEIGEFEMHDVAGSTGFYAILDTKKPGKTIGLRTDIDGLPVTESPLNGGGRQKSYLSKKSGCYTRLWTRWPHGNFADNHQDSQRLARQVDREVCFSFRRS
jgi:hypothetical protein